MDDDKASTGTRVLAQVHGDEARGLPDKVIVKYLTRCQGLLTLRCGNTRATCDSMEDLVSGLVLYGAAADEPHLNRVAGRRRMFFDCISAKLEQSVRALWWG
jgi:hypothetical protein